MIFGIADLILDAKFPDPEHKLVALAFAGGPMYIGCERRQAMSEFDEKALSRIARLANITLYRAESCLLTFLSTGFLIESENGEAGIDMDIMRGLSAGRISWAEEVGDIVPPGIWSLDWVDDDDAEQAKKKPIPAIYRLRVFARDGYKCKHCGSTENLRCDHVFPESKGGRLELSNLQTLCLSCNSKKGATLPEGAQP